jgi:Condensation domain
MVSNLPSRHSGDAFSGTGVPAAAEGPASITVSFTGTRACRAPLTWGQNGMWLKFQRDPDCDLNGSYVLTVQDEGVSVAAAADAISSIVARHEALRTRLQCSEGRVWQIVDKSGVLRVAITEAHEATLMTSVVTVARRQREAKFDLCEEFHMRTGFVMTGGDVRFIILTFSHFAADGAAAQILMSELQLALSGREMPGEIVMQPSDLAWMQERTPECRVQTERSARYWSAQYRRIPPTMFPLVGLAENPRRQQAVLVSPALEMAAEIIAGDARVTTSAVLLAATCAMAGVWTGHQVSAMNALALNRVQPGHGGLVTNLIQLGLVVLDLRHELSFREIARQAWMSALDAYRYAYYDQTVINRVIEEASRERGVDVNPFCCFNDLRGLGRLSHNNHAANGPVKARSEQLVRESLARTSLTWESGNVPWSRCRFCMQVVDHGPASALVLIADTCYLPRASIEGFLLDIEELLVRAAFHDVQITDIRPRDHASRALPVSPLLSGEYNTTLKMRRPLAACKAQLEKSIWVT